MPEEKKNLQEAPANRISIYSKIPFLIAIAVVICAVFTTGIAYSILSVVGSRAQYVEGELVDGVREFNISSLQWDYDPAALKVEPGDTVRFIVTSDDIMHGFAINELGINLALKPDVGVSQEMVIPEDMPSGVYTMYCSIFCGIGHPYMKGAMLVGEPGFEVSKILPYIATAIMAGMFTAFIIIGRRKAK